MHQPRLEPAARQRPTRCWRQRTQPPIHASLASAASRTSRRPAAACSGGRTRSTGSVLSGCQTRSLSLCDRAAIDKGIDATFEAFPRLAERRNVAAGTLSGGEQQMLGLGKAFILRPQLLLIDELSLGLAPKIVSELLEMVRRINADGTAVVLVEQSVNVALSLVDHAYFMEKGEIRFDGKAKDLLKRTDLLRSVFLKGAAAGLARQERARDDRHRRLRDHRARPAARDDHGHHLRAARRRSRARLPFEPPDQLRARRDRRARGGRARRDRREVARPVLDRAAGARSSLAGAIGATAEVAVVRRLRNVAEPDDDRRDARRRAVPARRSRSS